MKEIFEDAKEQQDTDTLLVVARLFDLLFNLGNTDLTMKLFNEDNWKLVFEVMEYLPNNFDYETFKKQHNYLAFLENESRMKVLDRNIINENFENIVKLRYRVSFFIDFVLDPKAPEQQVSHFQNVKKDTF